jgi:hypothetical protein
LDTNGSNPATNLTLLEYYATRMKNKALEPVLHTITSFNQFVTNYKVFKGQLILRTDEKIIIVTYPSVRYNIKFIEQYTDYCYYQMIKFSNWTIDDIKVLSDRTTAIKRFEEFFLTASEEIKENIKYTNRII